MEIALTTSLERVVVRGKLDDCEAAIVSRQSRRREKLER